MYQLRLRVVGALSAAACIFTILPANADGYEPGHSARLTPTTWTGLYLGAHIGGVWGDVDVTDDINDGVPPGPFGYSVDGVFGGGTAGYNWQVRNLVIGIEGDLGFIDPDGSGIIPSSTAPYHQDTTLDSGLYGDITGRLGFAFDRTLIYAKGGFAFFDGEATQTTTKPGFVTHGTDTFTGWTLGGGIEHMIAPNWSLKAEYLHFDFGSEVGDQTSVTDDPIGHVYHNWTDVSFDTVKVGVNYKFGGEREAIAPLK